MSGKCRNNNNMHNNNNSHNSLTFCRTDGGKKRENMELLELLLFFLPHIYQGHVFEMKAIIERYRTTTTYDYNY